MQKSNENSVASRLLIHFRYLCDVLFIQCCVNWLSKVEVQMYADLLEMKNNEKMVSLFSHLCAQNVCTKSWKSALIFASYKMLPITVVNNFRMHLRP